METGRRNGEKDPKRKRTKAKRICHECLTEYCSNTTIHGLRYVAESHRPVWERMCWFVAFALSFIVAVHQICSLWNMWNERPVIVSFAEQSTPVWEVPFPAITVCSESKANTTHINYTDLLFKSVFDKADEEDLKKLGQIQLLCDWTFYTEGDRFANDSVIEFFQEVSPPLQNVIFSVSWKSTELPPEYFFSPLLTDDGLCYTFNMLEASEMFTEHYHILGDFLNHGNSSPHWSLDDGYSPDSGLNVYPQRAQGAGAKAGISLGLIANKNDIDYQCMGPVQGFKVLLHNPADIPRVREQYLRVPLNRELVVGVTPSMMTTSEGLRNYSPQHRQCYFPSERQLRFFKVYTQNNCALECLANFTMEICGCVAFFMPRDESMPICGSGSISCMEMANDKLLEQEMKRGVDNEDNYRIGCDCLQSCTMLSYEVETSYGDIDWRSLPKEELDYAFDNKSESIHVAALTISFKRKQFITSRRDELYDQTQFLADCGGLLGLCLGFSVLSLVEIVYHFTLRLCCRDIKRGD